MLSHYGSIDTLYSFVANISSSSKTGNVTVGYGGALLRNEKEGVRSSKT